jgi:hypothetical protein
MSRLQVVLVLSLIVVPAAASAQRGGGSFGGAKKENWDSVTKSVPKGPSIEGKDLEEASPLRLFLDKKKDLKLTDAQQAAIKDADAKLSSANAARFMMVDSLRKQLKPSVAATAEDDARMALARDAMQGVLRDIRASQDAEAKTVVATLDPEQQKTAAELLEKHAEKTQKMLRDKMGGGGGPPPMGGGRRR